MEEWKEYRLGEVVYILDNNRVPLSSKTRSNRKGFYPYYGAQGVIDYIDDYIFDGTYLLVAEDGENLKSHKQPIAQIAKGKYWVNNHAHILESNGICDIRYICYLLNTIDISGYVTGSAQPKLNQENLKAIRIKLPSLTTQIKIADLVSKFDDKIELNRKINSNLEEQAKALFKSWFIDFEPFKDGKFVDSELGKIPEGWEVGRYDDIVSATVAGDWGKDKPIGNYVHEVTCIRGCDFQDIKNGLTGNAPSRFILEENFKNKCFANNDILVEISGGTQTVSTGRVCPISQELISRYNGNVVCTNFCRVLRPIEEYSAFIYYSWLYKYNHKVMFGYENGTSGIKNFRLNDFLSMEPLIIPPKDKVAEFQKVIDTINAQMQTTGLESSKLIETRDSLLPRLMSGEIDVRL